jgi:electron transfer flavoprotein beta subunit
VKVLVALKRVADPDHADRIRVPATLDRIDTSLLESKVNPFDHYALEAALRLTENAAAPKQRLGDVLAVTLGAADTEARLRHALATGATRALRIDARDEELDAGLVSRALAALAQAEGVELVLLGKQTVDSEGGQVGARVAELLGWPAATNASGILETQPGTLLVDREVDGGVLRVRLTLPAVVTVDLGVVAPRAVRSRHTAPEHAYGEGVRFASLLAARQAQQKPLAVRALAEFVADTALREQYVRYRSTTRRRAGHLCGTVGELAARLRQDLPAVVDDAEGSGVIP